jgi:hypothetical protein
MNCLAMPGDVGADFLPAKSMIKTRLLEVRVSIHAKYGATRSERGAKTK